VKALRIGKHAHAQAKAVINAGLDTLIVEVQSLEATISMKPDLEELKAFCVKNDVDIVLTYSEEVSTKGCAYRTRVFAPRFGYLEDPATGSGNSAFGYYLVRSKKWSDGVLCLEQNGSLQNPNFVKLSLSKEKEDVRVRFGGKATVKIKGEYFI
jgi:PhzF family phenazine biosynthesis protein